jgi:hypothetical protein
MFSFFIWGEILHHNDHPPREKLPHLERKKEEARSHQFYFRKNNRVFLKVTPCFLSLSLGLLSLPIPSLRVKSTKSGDFLLNLGMKY